jgi:predicted metal-dependent enzyme (double-stranded beta helix superfamily)
MSFMGIPSHSSLTLDELAATTRRFAEEVRAGRHEVHADPSQRWHVRIHADEDVDVWLISWTTEQGTQLHDHGGSAGAFTVVEGRLSESAWAGAPGGGELVEQSREAGRTVVFGTHYVHDVVNRAPGTAVSVHAYSPPLTQMNYYDVEGHRLVRRATSWTDDPEAPAPAREERAAS